jgi:hypothetical protein
MKITYLNQYFNTSEMSGGTRQYEMPSRPVFMGHESTWLHYNERMTAEKIGLK